jgi:subtilisin family serine protease
MRPSRSVLAAVTAAVVLLPAVTAAAEPSPSPVPSAEPRAAAGVFSYVVVTKAKDGADLAAAEQAVTAAGGTVLHSYPQVGVVVAHSTEADPVVFKTKVKTSPVVEKVGASRTVPDAVRTRAMRAPAVDENRVGHEATSGDFTGDPGEMPLWSLEQIKAYDAHKITEGDEKVVVAVVDSGVDDTHPDLSPNFAPELSVGCQTGAPVTTPAAWRPGPSDHGTHVAGTIAAAKNGTGVVGVAPKVRIASVRMSEDSAGSFFRAEAAVCAFTWLGDHAADGVKVANHSYYVDPWAFNCPEDEDQAAILESAGRAMKYAQDKGVLSLAAAGNANYDLAHKTTDATSPNDGGGEVRRTIPQHCLDIPTELPGVLTVSSTGPTKAKAGYSSYGLGEIDLAAPGGDHYVSGTRLDEDGILSTGVGGTWNWKHGTSMASPAATGVAALIASQHPEWGPAEIRLKLLDSTAPAACPVDYQPFKAVRTPTGIDVVPSDPGTCETGPAPRSARAAGAVTGFYGQGLADALAAVALPAPVAPSPSAEPSVAPSSAAPEPVVSASSASSVEPAAPAVEPAPSAVVRVQAAPTREARLAETGAQIATMAALCGVLCLALGISLLVVHRSRNPREPE